MHSLPPGPTSNAYLQLANWYRRPIEVLEESRARYGETFTLRLPGNPPFVVFSHPAAIKQIFTGDPDDLHAGEANVLLRSIVGDNSMLLLDGPRHFRERKLMMPSFHGERMRAYGTVMREVAARTVAGWPRGLAFPVHHEMQSITLDVILRTVFGLVEGPRLDRMRKRLIEYTSLGTSPVGTITLLFLPPRYAKQIAALGVDPVQIAGRKFDVSPLIPWRAIARAQRDVDAMLYEEFARRRASSDPPGDDVLSMLMAARDEDGKAMTDVELRDEMITLLLAGHETSATTLAWTVHHLLANPAALAEARAEIARVGGGGPVDPDDVGKLEYLDATIKESLRITPIIALVARTLKKPMRIGDYDLPAGVSAVACIYLAHHRPEVWSDPERFDPSRFLGRKPDPFSYFPFGGGTRRCIGMAFATYEMKIVLAEVLRSAALSRAAGPEVRLVRRGITFAPSQGVPVILG